jgi:hypothetical protein
MKVNELRELLNPYDYCTHRIAEKEFVGRKKHIEDFRLILDDYQQTTKFKNLIINGEKSIGKSTLANRFKQILQDYNIITYEVELSKDPNNRIDEFDFFKEFFGYIFENFSPIENTCLDARQQEIWYSLTGYKLEHDSNFIERKINFATQYSNRKKGISEKISIHSLKRDFERVVDAITSKDFEYCGIAILIDEFQELSKNLDLIDTLRILSEDVMGLMIIGTGLPITINNPSFEKFCRTAYITDLNKLSENEILDLIFKPLEIKLKCNRYQVQQFFDGMTLQEIILRCDGNPLHIRILCSKIFEYFKNNENSIKLIINRDVMDQVMVYYSSISEKSRRIKRALETCTKDQLSSFNYLYYYEGLSIRSIILLELAFESIQEEREKQVKNTIFSNIRDIYDLGLFEFANCTQTLDDLEKISSSGLSQVSYQFIGDTIDKLYASYYYEDITKERLLHNNNRSFEELLAKKLATFLGKAIVTKKVLSGILEDFSLGSIERTQNFDNQDLLSDYNKLYHINPGHDNEDNMNIKTLQEITKKHKLEYPAHLASIFEFHGYYILLLDISIKGKRFIIRSYYPVKGDIKDIIEIREQITDYTKLVNASLDEYLISINWIYLYWLPQQIFAKVFAVGIGNEYSKLVEHIIKREFEEAVFISRRIVQSTITMREDTVYGDIGNYNNFGFCLLNIEDFEESLEIFTKLKDKYLFSRINLSFAYCRIGNWAEAKLILKQIAKKLPLAPERAAFFHLALVHPALKMADVLVEDITTSNLVNWNLALGTATFDYNETAINSYLKKVKACGSNDEIIHQRVMNWITFYKHEIKKAIEESIKLKTKVKKDSYLFAAIEKDIYIFQQN